MTLRSMTRAAAVAAIVAFHGAAFAAPADIATAVAAKGRAEADVKLDEGRKPVEVLKFLGLEKGDRALDLMAGGGYYSEIMARAVGPKGYIVAWNHPGFAASDRIKAAWAGIKDRVANTSMFATPLPDLALAPASFDFAMLHLIYHDTYWESAEFKFVRVDPDVVLAKLFRAMKPDGIVGVVDHVGPAGVDTRELVEKSHRIDPAVVRADFERAGFVFDGESELLRNPADDKAKGVFDPAVRGKTDRIVYRFKKAARVEVAATGCDAGKVQNLVGAAMSDAVGAKAQRDSGARALRTYKTGDPVTMDYSPDRLNIETDAGGKIVRLSCG